MNTSSIQEYRENRAKLPLDTVRKLAGKWVAFSKDGLRVLASAATIKELSDEVQAQGQDLQHVVLEHVQEDAVDSYLGGMELS